jgi:cytochrome c-type biogenesis protein CcmH
VTRVRALLLAILLLVGAPPAMAVQPDEVLSDPALEARARDISRHLRCPVCQGENIDESNAGVARDLRLVLRERLVAGDSDAEVIDFIVARYGEFVLFEPKKEGANLILWVAGPAMLALALALAALTLTRRRTAPASDLSPEEAARVKALLDGQSPGG